MLYHLEVPCLVPPHTGVWFAVGKVGARPQLGELDGRKMIACLFDDEHGGALGDDASRQHHTEGYDVGKHLGKDWEERKLWPTLASFSSWM